ncbi:B12-binding domain-containing radical SAM protein [Candidatus Pacearchaeota archaeon]|nr:B12-binding domain-containing radical SAM protein [Candidatus Pacearchaeota archaeon]
MNNKKIILINRPLVRVRGLKVPSRKWQPLELAYVAAILEKENIECKIVDARVLNLSVDDVIREVKNFQPDLVVFASDPFDFYQCPNPNWQTLRDTITGIKKITDTKIVSFGPQMNLFDKKLMTELKIDFAIKGDNPLLTAEVALDVLREGKSTREGISYFDDRGTFVSGKVKHLMDLNLLPVPAYHLLPMERYTGLWDFPGGTFSVIIASRGCPFHCRFCYKGMIGDKVRMRSVDQVMEEIKTLVNSFNIKSIFFFDEIFTFDRGRIIELCQRIINAGYDIKWGCQSRIDFIDKEMLDIMYKAGCRYMSYGIETGSQRISKLANKQIDLNQAGEIIQLTRESGIYPHTNILYGFPQETKKDFRESIEFLKKYGDEDNMPAKINFFVGSPYYDEYLAGVDHREAVVISQKLTLSKMKPTDAERGLARWMLYCHWKKREFNLTFLYFIAKFLFPGLIIKVKEIRGKHFDSV